LDPGHYFYIGLHNQFAAYKDRTNPADRPEFAQVRLGSLVVQVDLIPNTFDMSVLLTDER